MAGGGCRAPSQCGPRQGAARVKAMLAKSVKHQKGASAVQEGFFNPLVLWYRDNGVQAPQQW